jgi:hypothetical protein
MRKILLASAAVLVSTGGLALAQSVPVAPPSAVPNDMQGQYIGPLVGGPGANNNLNAFGTANPGAAPAPAPGTVVIRLNARVYTAMDYDVGTVSVLPAGANGAGSSGYKINPVKLGAWMRLYPGVDGMASNGLRYGAAIEIRQNFEGGNSLSGNLTPTTASTSPAVGGALTTLGNAISTSTTAASSSGVSSAQTLFTRRAFVYVGSDQTGIVRIGEADGLIGIYDATGVFTGQNYDGGIGGLNSGGGQQSQMPNDTLSTWPFLSGNGIEYDSVKIVYLSPQFFGLDFGLQYDPSSDNGFAYGATSDAYAIGPCGAAGANCPGVTSGIDGTKIVNRFAGGVRYNGTFGAVGLQGYATYTVSGHESAPAVAVLPNPHVVYEGQSFFNGGLAVSALGFTLSGDTTIGSMNSGNDGPLAKGSVTTKGAIASLSYANGPLSAGISSMVVDWQGVPNLVGVTQRHEAAVAIGGAYKLAPGLTMALEYQYDLKHQGGFNFITSGTTGALAGAYNTIKSQGITFATIMSW